MKKRNILLGIVLVFIVIATSLTSALATYVLTRNSLQSQYEEREDELISDYIDLVDNAEDNQATDNIDQNANYEDDSIVSQEKLIEVGFIVETGTLSRPAGGSTKFTFQVPNGSVITKTPVSQNISNPEMNYTISGDEFDIYIAQPYSTFALQFNSSLTSIGTIDEIGKVWSYKLPNGSYNYTSRVIESGDCTKVDGAKINSPCGEPGVEFVDEDLESYFTYTCSSENKILCDSIVKSVIIDVIVGSACGGNEGCI